MDITLIQYLKKQLETAETQRERIEELYGMGECGIKKLENASRKIEGLELAINGAEGLETRYIDFSKARKQAKADMESEYLEKIEVARNCGWVTGHERGISDILECKLAPRGADNRRIDGLGRVVIPREVRQLAGIFEDDRMEIKLYNNTIVLNKEKP